MYFQQLESDIATISKSAKGRVLFFDADGVCVLGLSETSQIQMQYSGGYIYVIQDGGGTSVPNQSGASNTPMGVNSSFYKFTVIGLTDIDGRPYTALTQPNYDMNTYLTKVRDAYEYLVGNIFVGCCNTSTDSILWYADEASFPATGIVETLYVDMATPALFLWDGAAYVQIGGGGGVASVTGYSVDNTDPANPIVKAIPIAGTDAAEPVTGDIEVNDGVAFYSEDGSRNTRVVFSPSLDEFLRIRVTDGVSPKSYIFPLDNEVNSSSVLTLNVLKKRIWTKAGTPTTTDDSTEGYLVGSLIWDTTNSILYRCTDNTASAAVWTYANVQSDVLRTGNTVPAGATRWAAPGFSGISTTAVVNIAEKAIHTNFRVMTGTAQPASGSITITRQFTDPIGTVLQNDVLTIPAGSAIGAYEFTGASFNSLTLDTTIKFVFLNNSSGASAFIQGIQRDFIVP
jgi:hypothetical protein